MSLIPHVRKTVALGFIASMALSSIPAIAHAEPVNSKPSPASSSPGGEEKRYIVRYENNVDAENKSNSLKAKGIEVKDTLSHAMKASVVVADSREIEELKKNKDVAAVELDQKVTLQATTSLWSLDRIDQRTGRDGQYNIGDEGAGVNVYVMDSGINSSHTDFSGRILPGWNGLNDGTGTSDCNGHGTHVAGTVAGTKYGVAKKANIVPLKALQCDGSGWSSTVVAGIDWAIAHHQAGKPAVLNMSIGGFSAASLDYAVQNAVNDGITVVAAAGNSNQDACLTSPSKVGPAITVAAMDINNSMASFSNYGSCVDIQAPGVSILSAWNNSSTGYNTMSGTSMATPHVAGAAAILLSRTPSLSPAQVHQAIVNNATTGAISNIKGSTVNRLLFIPALAVSAPAPAPAPTPVTGSVIANSLDAIDTSGTYWSYSAPNNGTLGGRSYIGGGWGNAQQIIKADWNSDGILDIVARWSSGYVTMYAGLGNNSYRAPINIGSGGWQNMDINAVKLKNTDKYPGLVARDTVSGNLYYYPNTTGGAMTAIRTQIGFGGWTPMTEISAMDWDNNGNMDLVVRNSAGELKLYRTDGNGTILNEARQTLDWGWNVMDHIAIQHGFAGPGTVGIIARSTGGVLYYYPISAGKVQPSKIIGNGGWSGYKIASGTP